MTSTVISIREPSVLLRPKKNYQAQHNNIIEWNTFFRYNVDEFIVLYFGINLHDYQKIVFHSWGMKLLNTDAASRATAKSWMAAIFSCAYSVLYPNSKAVICSPTKGQSSLLIQTISATAKQHPNLEREILRIRENKDDSQVFFKNGSILTVVPMTEGGRGYRANLIIVEEAASVKKKILDEVILPFSFQRPAPFRMKKKYQFMKEPARKIYIGSIKDKSNWFYKHCLQQILIVARGDPNKILQQDQVSFFAFNYLISLYHNIKTREDIMADRIDFDSATWQQEYENIPTSENEDAFFQRLWFENNQKVKEAWFPATPEEFASGSYKKLQREKGERLRVIMIDIALASSTKTANNDLTAIHCVRVFEKGAAGFHRDDVYLESFSGANTKEQSVRIRQIADDFDADVYVLDCKGVGKGIYDTVTDYLPDPIRGVVYPPIKAMADKSISEDVAADLRQRVISPEAIPKIYPFIGGEKNNSDMWYSLKDNLKLGKISFLLPDNEAEEYFEKKYKDQWETNTSAWRATKLNPYKETMRLMAEAISLESKVSMGYVKLIEKPKARKDRIVSLGMGNFYIDLVEAEYLKSFSVSDIVSYLKKINGSGHPGGFDPGAGIFS